MKNKNWIYQALVVVAVALFAVSFCLPWWSTSMTLQGMSIQENAIQVFSYGLKHQLNQLRPYIIEDETPLFQTILAFAYLGVSLAAAVISAWLKSKKGSLLLLICGIGYIAYVSGATYVIIHRLDDLGIVLQGWSKIIMDVRSITFKSSLEPGYYLAYVSGVLLFALALLRIIIDKMKSAGKS